LAVRARSFRGVILALAALFVATPALADDEPVAPPPATLPSVDAALELAAPEGCGSESALGASITRRSDRIRIDPTSARRLRIQIRAEGQLTRVTIELEQPSGRRSSRTLRASSCDEALEAAALVAAVSLDPTASALLDPPPPPPPPPPPEPAPKPVPPPEPPPPPPPRVKETIAVSGAVLGEATWRPAPRTVLGVQGVVMVGWERDSVLSPAVRIRGGRGWADKPIPDRGPGIVRFRLTTSTLEVCPLRFGVPVLSILPCAYGTGGRLWAAGRQFPRNGFSSKPWWVVGGSAVLLFRPIGPLEVQASGGVGWNQRRDSFTLSGPDQQIHVVRAASGSVGVGFGLVFR
jgi:hypothetical protein